MSIVPLQKKIADSIVAKNESMINEGKQICEENEFMRLLMQVGEDAAFKKLIKGYCKTGMDMKTIFMYLKLYVHIDEYYRPGLNEYQKICIISNLIKNRETRRFIVEKTQNFLEE